MANRELKEQRKIFKKEIKEAFKNPERYFEIVENKNPDGTISRTYNQSKLQEFYQNMCKCYLDPIASNVDHNNPNIVLKDLSESKSVAGKKGGGVDTNSNSLDIVIDANQILNYNSRSGLRKNLAFGMMNVCHEYRHTHQKLYDNLVRENKTEDAQKIGNLLGKNKEKIAADFHNKTQDTITFLEATMSPEQKEQFDKVTKTTNAKNGPLNEAFYIHRASEVDARAGGLEYFNIISKDVGLFNTAGFYLNGLSVSERVKNNQILNKQPQKVVDMIEEAKNNISGNDFLTMSNIIDRECKNRNISPSSLTLDLGITSPDDLKDPLIANQNAFIEVLEDKLSNMDKENGQKFLDLLQENCAEGSYASTIIPQIREKVYQTETEQTQASDQESRLLPENEETDEQNLEEAPVSEQNEPEQGQEEIKEEITPDQEESLDQSELSSLSETSEESSQEALEETNNAIQEPTISKVFTGAEGSAAYKETAIAEGVVTELPNDFDNIQSTDTEQTLTTETEELDQGPELKKPSPFDNPGENH